jgi:DNA-directed RNA polymerase specialized sigma24 family protein
MAEDILMMRPERFLNKQYNVTLFKLYYEEGLNYREISELTKINISSVAQSIKGSIKYLKEKMKIRI